MVLSFIKGVDDGRPIFSTYIEGIVQSLKGNFVVSGCEVAPVSGSLQVSVSDGQIKYNDSDYSVSATTLSLNAASNKVRYDVVVWDYNNGNPTLAVLTGTDELELSDGSVVYKTQRLTDSQVPLAVIKVRPGVTELTSDDIYDARVSGTVSSGGGASSLDELSDVTLSSPSTGQVLKYDGSEWKNDVVLWDEVQNKPNVITDAGGAITSGTLWIDNYSLVIGANGDKRVSGEGIELYGGISSAYLSVQDGNGRIQIKWNATRGTNETFLVGSENAERIEFNPANEDVELFAVYFGDGSNANAGDTISWQNVLNLGLNGLKIYKSGIYPGSDNALKLGAETLRWSDTYTVNLYTGDIVFMNGWRITEFDDDGNLIDGLRFLDAEGNEVFRITKGGVNATKSED